MAPKTFKLRNGQDYPSVGLGTCKANDDEIIEALKYAILECGYRAIDTAEMYQNEEAIGRGLQEIFKTVPREEIVVTTKFWNDHHSREGVRAALQESLKKLQLDYIDTYLVHWPMAVTEQKNFDKIFDGSEKIEFAKVPLRDTWEELEKLVDEGLIKNLGVSNFGVQLLLDLLTYARIMPSVNQCELTPYLPQHGLVKFCLDQGILPEAYGPLGALLGIFHGNDKYENVKKCIENEDIVDIAKKHGKSPAQVILAWNLARGVKVIPKSSNPGRVLENLRATEVELDAEDIAKINAITTRVRIYESNHLIGYDIFA